MQRVKTFFLLIILAYSTFFFMQTELFVQFGWILLVGTSDEIILNLDMSGGIVSSISSSDGRPIDMLGQHVK